MFKAVQFTGTSNPCFHQRTKLDDNTLEDVRRDRSNSVDRMRQDRKDPRSYSCVVSKARADYKTEKITASKTSSVDINKHEDDSSDNYT